MESSNLHFSSALTDEGWMQDVAIQIDAAGFIERIEEGSRDGRHVNGTAVPAMPNIHSHAHQRLMQGLAERAGFARTGQDSFWTWREIMYGFAMKLGPDDLEAVAAQLYVEMLKAGFSVVGEFQYLHHQPDGTPYDNPAEMSLRCLSAANQAGIAVTMLPTLYNFGNFGGKQPGDGQRRFLNNADRFLGIFEKLKSEIGANPLWRLGFSPHSFRAVTHDLLTAVIGGIDTAAPIHVHVAEQNKEVTDCLAWCGNRPVQYMLNQYEITGRWTAIHATHMTAQESARLAKSGAIAGLCPTTEANLGDGIFPAVDYLAAKGAIAIGSDSHISVSPAEDLRMLEYSQRLRDHTRNALSGGPGLSTGRSILERALRGGARSMTQPVGRLAPGYRADIAVIDDDHSTLIGRTGNNLLDTWIFSGGNVCVKDVFVAGRQLVRDRHHIHEDEIAARFRSTVKRLTS